MRIATRSHRPLTVLIGFVIATMIATMFTTTVGVFTGSAARADSLLTTLNVGVNPHDIVIDSTGTYAYAVGCDYGGIPGRVLRINLATFTVDDSMVVSSDCARAVQVVDDSIYVTTSDRFYRFNAATFGTSTDDSVAIDGYGNALAVSGSFAYVAHHAGGAEDKITKIDISGTSVAKVGSPFSSGGEYPMSMEIDPAGAYAYVVHTDSDTMTKIDLTDDSVAATVAIGNQSYGLRLDDTGTFAYVPAAAANAGASSPWMVRVDLATLTWDDTVALPFEWGFDVALTPDGAFAYVGESRSGNPGRIAKIALGANMSLVETISSNPGSHALTIDPTGSFVYSADYNDHNQTTISKIAISAGPPTVTGLSVAAGPLGGGGTTVISGTNFTGVTGVSFGGTAATVLSSSDDTIAVTVPAAGSAGPVNVTVTTGSGTSSQTVPFTYAAAPVVTSMTPDSGPIAGGTVVTITGTELSGATVDIDGDAVATTSNTATTIEFATPVTPAGAATVTVTTAGGAVSAGSFTFIDPTPPMTPAPNPPGAPGTPSAIAGDGSAVVSWSQPASAGSFPVSTYQVMSAPGGHTCLTVETSCEISGLENGTDYTFTVRALSGAGWSSMSRASSVVTPTASTITITGSRAGKRLRIAGVVSGVDAATRLTAVVERSTRSGKGWSAMAGRHIEVAADGTFTWSRRASARMAWRIHFTTDTGLASNTLVFG